MNIASQYAVLSEDGNSLMLPGDVRSWLKGINRFLVIMENDRLILKKANTLKKAEFCTIPNFGNILTGSGHQRNNFLKRLNHYVP